MAEDNLSASEKLDHILAPGRIVVEKETIQTEVKRIAAEIKESYGERFDSVIAVILLEGARFFANDLIKEFGKEIECRFVKASSYYNGTTSSGKVKIDGGLVFDVEGRDLLLIDDIYDSGTTFRETARWLKTKNPASLKSCVMFRKEGSPDIEGFSLDFLGMMVEDIFLVGYGLDHAGKYRELPFVCALENFS